MKKILFWLIAVIFVQLGSYLYFDKIVFAPAVNFTQEEATGESLSSALKYSYDGSYYAQIVDAGLEVYKGKDKKLVKEIPLKENQNITYFTWLPERNIGLIGISESKGKSGKIILTPVNPETDSQPESPEVNGLSEGAEIVDIAFSTKTNVINLLVKKGNYAAVYRTDANNIVQNVNTGTNRIRKIASLKHEDLLIYDNIRNGSVYAIDGDGKDEEISPQVGKYSLIGVDKADNIYIGKLDKEEKLVESVLIGKYDGTFTEFKTLANPYPADSVQVSYEGKILLN